VVPRRVELRFGQEELDERVAGMAAVAVVGQVRQHPGRLQRAEPADRPLSLAEAEAAQQLKRPDLFHGGYPSRASTRGRRYPFPVHHDRVILSPNCLQRRAAVSILSASEPPPPTSRSGPSTGG